MVEKRKDSKTVIDRVARRGVLCPTSQTLAGETGRVPQRQDPAQVLAVDVGNTFIHFAIFKGGASHVTWRASVKTKQKPSDLKKQIEAVLVAIGKRYPANYVAICSVVPSVTAILEPLIKQNLKVNPMVIGRDIVVPIKNLYSEPKQVGQDRLVAAYQASFVSTDELPLPVIVIDLGTAITIDVVSAKREYLGGIIVPGIDLTAEMLFERTALLPRVEVAQPKHLIGKDTSGSILSGIFYGYGEMLKGLVELITVKTFKNPKLCRVVMTGGHARLMAKYVGKRVHCVDPDLVLKGIAFLSRL